MTETAAETPTQASLWEDFLDIFYAPRDVFERRRYAGFGIVLVVLTLVLTVLYFASQGPLGEAYMAEFRRGMAQAGAAAQQMTPEQMEGARRSTTIFGTLAVLVILPLAVLLIGTSLWALGMIFGSEATPKMAILVVTYAQFPRVLQSVAGLVQGIFLDPRTLAATSIGPARFLDPSTTSQLVIGTLMRTDIFFVWSTVLIAIGIQVLGKVPRAQSYVLAVLVWIVGAVPPLLGALAR